MRRRESISCTSRGSPRICLVLSGHVLEGRSSRGDDTRAVLVAGPGQILFSHQLYPPAEGVGEAIALTDGRFWSVPVEDARHSVALDADCGARLCAYLAGRLEELIEHVVLSTTLDVRGRTASLLLRLSDRLGTEVIPLTQDQLAMIVGTRRETLALILGRLRREGALQTRYRRLQILDRDVLRTHCLGGYPRCAEGPNLPPVAF